jgi:hypothetical protein
MPLVPVDRLDKTMLPTCLVVPNTANMLPELPVVELVPIPMLPFRSAEIAVGSLANVAALVIG